MATRDRGVDPGDRDALRRADRHAPGDSVGSYGSLGAGRAGNDVTMARFAKTKELEGLHKKVAMAEGKSAGSAWVTAREKKRQVEHELAQARKELEVLRAVEGAATR